MSISFDVFGRNNCVWCDRAKALLDEHKLEYEFENIETNRYSLASFKALWPTAKTVPQIAVWLEDGTYENIGGYTELVEWLKQYTSKS